MNIKTKLFSLIILAILVLPVFINPPKSGNVLGVSETKNATPEQSTTQTNQPPVSLGSLLSKPQETPQNQPQDSNALYKLKDISSGIRDTKKKNSNQREMTGKIIWDANAKSSAISDKFSLGSGIRLTYGTNVVNVVVGEVRVLSPDTIMIVDQKTFAQLGGNLEKDISIDVTAIVE
jgi:hypothetical protein